MEKLNVNLNFEERFGPKIDLHTHLGRISAEDRVRANQLLGISKCMILPGAPDRAPRAGMNFKPFTPDMAYEVVQKYPEYYSWFCNVTPDGTDNTYKTLAKYKEMGAKGVGEMGTRYRFDDPRMEHLFAVCQELELPVLFHMAPEDADPYYGIIDDPRLPGLEGALKKFPKLMFIGHSQAFWFELGETDETDPFLRNKFPHTRVVEGRVPKLMREYPNLYGDLSANSGGNAMIRDPEYAVKFMTEFQDRLMYGSDWGGGVMRYPLAAWLDQLLVSRHLPEDIYRKVCRENSQRLFDM
jgi:predicted TIM-barrel fold metal-dependent hydrolase